MSELIACYREQSRELKFNSILHSIKDIEALEKIKDLFVSVQNYGVAAKIRDYIQKLKNKS